MTASPNRPRLGAGLHLGVGMSSAATAEEVARLVAEVVAAAGAGPVADVGTTTRLAADRRLAALGLRVLGHPPEALASVAAARSLAGSAKVHSAVGSPCVAEAAALAGAGAGGRLVVPRRSSAHVTAAAAVAGP